MLSILPAHIGLPQFASYRPNQQDAIARGLASPTQFTFLDMPTGDGKSLTYYTISRLDGLRTALLTSTKSLEAQLMRDFGGAGLVTIHGRNNYRCTLGGGLSCEDGADIKCTANKDGVQLPCECPYRSALLTAKSSEMYTSNYVYQALVNKHTDGIGAIDRLVCDEGHELPEIITGINEIYLSSRDGMRLRMRWPDNPATATSWIAWGRQAMPIAESLMADVKSHGGGTPASIKELGHLRNLCGSLAKIVNMIGWWIAEPVTGRSDGWRLEPVWAAEHAETTIWRGIPRIMITTATYSPSLPTVLGIPPDRYTVLSYNSSFATSRSPFYYIPTAQVREGWPASDQSTWMNRIDEIIGGRLDRKGIIHCTSYKRRESIMANSRYRHLMIKHDPGSESAMEAITRFKSLPANQPAVMVTPAMTTGYDFPYSTCRYQILANVPYPNTQSQVMQARTGRMHDKHTPEHQQGKLYEQQYIATQLAQAAGRGMRAPDDWCENFMIDNKFKYAYFSHQGVYPMWFRLLVRTSATVPPALNLNAGPY